MCLEENPDIVTYLDRKRDTISKTCSNVLEFLDKYLWIDRCKGLNNMNTFDETIIREGFSVELDEVNQRYKEKQPNIPSYS